jgi:hypothetical protein
VSIWNFRSADRAGSRLVASQAGRKWEGARGNAANPLGRGPWWRTRQSAAPVPGIEGQRPSPRVLTGWRTCVRLTLHTRLSRTKMRGHAPRSTPPLQPHDPRRERSRR